MVSEVKRGGRAAANGLVAGDVIVASSVGEFADLASWRATSNVNRSSLSCVSCVATRSTTR